LEGERGAFFFFPHFFLAKKGGGGVRKSCYSLLQDLGTRFLQNKRWARNCCIVDKRTVPILVEEADRVRLKEILVVEAEAALSIEDHLIQFD